MRAEESFFLINQTRDLSSGAWPPLLKITFMASFPGLSSCYLYTKLNYSLLFKHTLALSVLCAFQILPAHRHRWDSSSNKSDSHHRQALPVKLSQGSALYNNFFSSCLVTAHVASLISKFHWIGYPFLSASKT